MILIIIISTALGFYLLYQTSRRAAVRKSSVDLWLSVHPVFTKIIAVLLFITAIVLGTGHLGLGVSIFYTLTTLMAVSSLMIILFPVYYPEK